jgi:hypothetical protein
MGEKIGTLVSEWKNDKSNFKKHRR